MAVSPQSLTNVTETENKPTNHGKFWKDDEIEQMKDMIGNGVSVEDVAEQLGRTPGSIRAKLVKTALYMREHNSTDEEILQTTGITSDQIDKRLSLDIARPSMPKRSVPNGRPPRDRLLVVRFLPKPITSVLRRWKARWPN
jgi:hypothetical protein